MSAAKFCGVAARIVVYWELESEFVMSVRSIFFVLSLLVLLPLNARSAPTIAQTPSTLEQVQKRGAVACGVSAGATGFAQQDAAGEWSGFDVDFCRALAAALFDDPRKAQIIALAPKDRIAAVQSGLVDLLARGAAWTLSRDTNQRVLYAAVSFFDGQGLLTRKKLSYAAPQDLSGGQICVQKSTSHELDLGDFFRLRKVNVELKTFATFEEAAKAYEDELCQALSADVSALYAQRAKYPDPGEHIVLAEFISKAPLGPITREGDDQWFNIVRWTQFALVDAEDLGVGSANVDQALKSENPEIRRLLGVDGDHGDGLGLASDWVYRILKHVGNYGEVFERDLGQGSPIKMERRQNALWSKGGLMYAPPLR
jgi:general L-amino acid transport system substrate-binding protein